MGGTGLEGDGRHRLGGGAGPLVLGGREKTEDLACEASKHKAG